MDWVADGRDRRSNATADARLNDMGSIVGDQAQTKLGAGSRVIFYAQPINSRTQAASIL